MTATRVIVLVAVVAGLLTGCGAPGGRSLPDRLTGGSAVARHQVAWADGRAVHLGDRVVRAPGDIDQLALTAGGLYLRVNRRLLVVDGDEVRDTGQRLHGSFVVAPGGRYLAYLDRTHGPRDRFGTHRLTTALWDLRTRELVGSSSSGMGDTGSDDLYAESEVRVLGFTRSDLVVDTADGYRRLALTDGRERGLDLGPGERPLVATQEGFATSADRVGGRWRVDTFDGRLAVLSPSRRFLLVSDDGIGWTVTERGRPTRVPGLPHVIQPGPWLDDHTLAVIAFDGDQDPVAILRCDLDARRCSDVVRGTVLGEAPVLGSRGAGEI